MARSLIGTGLKLKLLDGASSSGTESARIIFDTPYSQFGFSVELVATSSHAGLTGAILYGTAAASTSVTTAQAAALCTWATDSGTTIWSSTDGRRFPVNQVWTVVTDAATSAASDMDVWLAAVP